MIRSLNRPHFLLSPPLDKRAWLGLGLAARPHQAGRLGGWEVSHEGPPAGKEKSPWGSWGNPAGSPAFRQVARSETRDTLAPLDSQAGLLGTKDWQFPARGPRWVSLLTTPCNPVCPRRLWKALSLTGVLASSTPGIGRLPLTPPPQAAYESRRWQRQTGRRKKTAKLPNSSLGCHGYCLIIRDECYWLLWQPEGTGSIPTRVTARRQVFRVEENVLLSLRPASSFGSQREQSVQNASEINPRVYQDGPNTLIDRFQLRKKRVLH